MWMSRVAGKWAHRKFDIRCIYCIFDTHKRRVPYAALAKAFSLIEATTKRLEKTSLLTTLFLLVIERSAEGDHDSLLKTVYLCINRVR